MPDTFESLLVQLSRDGVDYLVAGGVAVCLNGFVRTTYDLDLLVEDSPRNLSRLLDSLSRFGEGCARELTPEDFPLEEGAVRLVEDFTVDLFTLMRSRRFADFATTARNLVVDDSVIRFLDPHALIELKGASTRDKDRLDVSALRELMNKPGAEQPVNLVELTPPIGEVPEESD